MNGRDNRKKNQGAISAQSEWTLRYIKKLLSYSLSTLPQYKYAEKTPSFTFLSIYILSLPVSTVTIITGIN